MKKAREQGKGKKGQVKRQETEGKGRAGGRSAARRLPRVPPPDSPVWPEQYRAERWKPAYAILFAGKCQLCAYSSPLSQWRQGMDKCMGMTRLLQCTNHPDSPGELVEVLPIETCRNFKPKWWQRPRAKPAPKSSGSTTCESDREVRRIALGNNLFAIVDAADYEKLSKYRWYVYRHGSTMYAFCRKNGRTVYMHRMLMRPRKGYVVDHIDGNGLNNRRCNLRVCTSAQNRVNTGPRGGTSRFVGVRRQKDKWAAGITYRGKYYHAGLYEDEVEAAKARDRKAYELHGPYAYLNFPQDFRR